MTADQLLNRWILVILFAVLVWGIVYAIKQIMDKRTPKTWIDEDVYQDSWNGRNKE